MILGITGGTGCGKTTLLSILQEHGALVMDCDEIYHELLECDTDMLNAIRHRFPEAFQDGCFDRKELGKIVFSDPYALQELNGITHSAVKKEVLRRLALWDGTAAIDAIALFESGLASLCNLTVAVTAPTGARVDRLTKRDGISEEYARSRIAAQHDDEWFRDQCNVILSNDSDPETFRRICIDFLQEHDIIQISAN